MKDLVKDMVKVIIDEDMGPRAQMEFIKEIYSQEEPSCSLKELVETISEEIRKILYS